MTFIIIVSFIQTQLLAPLDKFHIQF